MASHIWYKTETKWVIAARPKIHQSKPAVTTPNFSQLHRMTCSDFFKQKQRSKHCLVYCSVCVNWVLSAAPKQKYYFYQNNSPFFSLLLTHWVYVCIRVHICVCVFLFLLAFPRCRPMGCSGLLFEAQDLVSLVP